KITKPQIQPTPNEASATISRSLIALRKTGYNPTSNRIKLPEIPGSTIAQIATNPPKNNIHQWPGNCAGAINEMARINALPRIKANQWLNFQAGKPLTSK